MSDSELIKKVDALRDLKIKTEKTHEEIRQFLGSNHAQLKIFDTPRSPEIDAALSLNTTKTFAFLKIYLTQAGECVELERSQLISLVHWIHRSGVVDLSEIIEHEESRAS